MSSTSSVSEGGPAPACGNTMAYGLLVATSQTISQNVHLQSRNRTIPFDNGGDIDDKKYGLMKLVKHMWYTTYHHACYHHGLSSSTNKMNIYSRTFHHRVNDDEQVTREIRKMWMKTQMSNVALLVKCTRLKRDCLQLRQHIDHITLALAQQ